jgi:hypothetical protein
MVNGSIKSAYAFILQAKTTSDLGSGVQIAICETGVLICILHA